MYRKKALFVILFICCAFLLPKIAFAKNYWLYSNWYNGFINYDNSNKKDYAIFSSLYLSGGDIEGKNTIQLGISQTHVNYKTSNDLDQQDFTLIYSATDWIKSNATLSLGIHYISTDDKLTDNGYIALWDFTKFYGKGVYFKKSWGIGGAYSIYSKDLNFEVLQVNPHFAYKFYTSPSKGTAIFYLVGYYINVSKANDPLLGLGESNYFSVESDISYYYKKYAIHLGAWVGKQAFAVKKSGFVVYNLGEKFKGGAFLEISRFVSDKLKIGLLLSADKYSENGETCVQEVGSIYLGYYF